MELIEYQRYIEENGFVSIEKSQYFVNCVKRFSMMNFSNMLTNQGFNGILIFVASGCFPLNQVICRLAYCQVFVAICCSNVS